MYLSQKIIMPKSYSLPSLLVRARNAVEKILKQEIIMHPGVLKTLDKGYVVPTNEDIVELKKYVGWSTNELAAAIDITPKRFRELQKERSYIKGWVIQYAPWRLLIESFGMVRPLRLRAKRPKLRKEIFEDGEKWKQPTTKEVRLLFRRSDKKHDELTDLLGLNESLSKHLVESQKSQILPIEKDKWFQFLKGAGLESVREFLFKPNLPKETLLAIDEGYNPPRPNVLRKFVAWSGYSGDELARLIGMEESSFGFYCSNRSFRGGDESVLTGLFSRDAWRPPFTRELRAIITVSKCDPVRAAKALGIGVPFMMSCMKSSESKRVHVDKEKWLKFMDELGYFSAEQFNELAVKMSESKPIPYASWRLLLYVFGVVEPTNFQRKENK